MKSVTKKHPFRHASLTILSLAFILTLAGLTIIPAHTSSQTSQISIQSDASGGVAVQAAGRGNPLINLKDGRDLPTLFSARSSLRQALVPGAAQPLALASDDFDGDGLGDLVVAYSSPAGGIVSVHRGNISAFAAEGNQQLRTFAEGGDVAAFHDRARATDLPETPHFIGTGDFNRDGYKDIVAGSKGGSALWVLEGDGRGEFTQASRYEVPGSIDAMATGDLLRRDGAADVAVAISGPQGPELLVYEGQSSIFMREPVRAALPSASTSIAVGDLDGDSTVDIALAAGSDLVIAQGYDQLAGSADARMRVERTGFPFALRGIAVGEFIWDRDGKPEVAILSDAGMVHIATRGELDRRGFTQDEIIEWVKDQGKHRSPYTRAQLHILRERLEELGYPKTAAGGRPSRQQSEQWTVAESHQVAEHTSDTSSLVVANLSGGSPMDLMVTDPAGRRLHVLMGEREALPQPDQREAVRRERPPAVSFDVDGEPVAALALKLNFDTRPDLVVIRKDHLSVVVAPSAPLATFTVDRTDDNAGASACTAAANDCSLRGAFKAANANAGPDAIVVPAGTYTLTLGPADDDALVLSNENAGDLDIRGIFDGGSADNDITLTGAGAATTIIQASATPGIGIDRLIDVDPVFGGGALNFSVSGVTLRHGRAQAPNSAGGDGGAIRFLGAQLPHSAASIEGTLTITNCTISTNQSTNPTAGAPGGAINVVFGKVNISGSTFSGNNAGNGAGGAILFDGGLEGDSAITISSTTFSDNTTLNNTTGSGGALFTAGGRNVSLTNTSFSNNQAAVDGGGYRISITQAGFSITISGGTYSGNLAGRHGGGIYSDPQDTGTSTPVTISNATFSGNIADSDNNNVGDGGGIFHNRGMLTLTNTNMSGTANTAVNGGGLAHRFVSGVTPSNTSTIAINGGTFSGNTAKSEGGAIFQDSTNEAGAGSVFNIGSSGAVTIQNNSARAGGGGIANLNSGDVNITGGVISGNTADSDNNNTGDGGGIFNSNATVTVGGSASIGQSGSANSAVNGGGIRHVSGTFTMTGGSVSFNTAKSNGGGVSAAATVTFNSGVSFSNNSANVNGGAIHVTGGTANINGGGMIQGNTADNDNNNTGDGGGIFNGGGTVLLPNSTTIGGAGALRNRAENGGGIRNASGTVTMTGGSITSNQAVNDGGGLSSGGTTTLNSSVSVTNNSANNSGGGIAGTAGTTTVNGASSITGNTANADSTGGGDGGGIFNNGATINMPNGPTIGGAGALRNAAANGGGIHSLAGSLSMTGGSITGNQATSNGGGVGLAGGTVTLSGISITSNTATGNGGGISKGGGTLDLTNVTIGAAGQSNSANNGGGIANSGGTLTIDSGDATITNNTATASGGGLFASGGTVNLSGLSLSNNSAANGGAAAATGGTVNITATQIVNNSATASGGGLFNNGGTFVVSLSRFFGNTAPSGTAVHNMAGTVTAENNWWGCDDFPASGTMGCQTAVGTVDADPRIDLRLLPDPTAVPPGGTSTLKADVTQNTDGMALPGGAPAVLEGLTATFATDSAGTITPPLTATISGGMATRTWTAGPDGGDSTVSVTLDNGTQTAVITIQVPPMITCPGNITVNNDPGLCTASVAFNTTATGNPPPTVTCTIGMTVITSPHDFPVGTSTVTCTATNGVAPDATCSFTVTVIDNEPPAPITCPANITATEDPQGSGTAVVNYTTPTSTDNCSVTVTCMPASGTAFPIGMTTVTCTAADPSGNTQTCTFTVTVNPACQLTCPANITASNDAGQCGAVVTYSDPATTGDCGTVTCNPPSGAFFPVGTTTVTCTAQSGPTCSFTVTVNDMEMPVITCPANIAVGNDPGLCSAVVNFNVTATDNCPGVTVMSTPASGSVFPLGTTTVTATATDASGNTATCSFTVTVNDTEPPQITCPADITVNADPDVCSAVVNYTVPTPTDNCPGVGTAMCTPAPGSIFAVGTTTVTCNVTDAAGNTASCTFMVTVNDTMPPEITCPANITVSNDPGACSAVVSFKATATDNCPDPSVVCSPASGTAFPTGTTTVTCTATDQGGNTDSCSFTVTVNDTEAPVITCPANITVGNDPGLCSAVVNFNVTATDNCPGVGMPMCSPASGSTFAIGTTPVTCTVTDAAGNTASCSFSVTVNDIEAPAVMCPANITVNAAAGTCSAVVMFSFSASDNCPGVQAVANPPSGTAFPGGTTTVTVTATDASGNASVCTFTVTVLDAEAPEITCPPNQTAVTASPGDTQVAVSYPAPTVTDSCPGTTVSCTPPSGSLFPLGITTVVCTATDAAGNTDTCSFTVSVFDICLQDDSDPSVVLLINSATGAYRFCCGGTTIVGTGRIIRIGSTFVLQHITTDRRLIARLDAAAGAGNATLQFPPGVMRCMILDRDISDNTCSCM